MKLYRELKTTRTLMGRLNKDDDLFDQLTAICLTENISLGKVEAIGALKNVTLAYYNQDNFTYQTFSLKRHLEIIGLQGNISLKEGVPIIHAHISLADDKGHAFGGHLMPGSKVFACEFVIQLFQGETLHRTTEPLTQLPLWEF